MVKYLLIVFFLKFNMKKLYLKLSICYENQIFNKSI